MRRGVIRGKGEDGGGGWDEDSGRRSAWYKGPADCVSQRALGLPGEWYPIIKV